MSWIVHEEQKAKAAGVTDEDEVLYAITVEDVACIYEEDHGEDFWDTLGAEEKVGLCHRARGYVEDFCGVGAYNYTDAIREAIQDFEKGEQGGEQ